MRNLVENVEGGSGGRFGKYLSWHSHEAGEPRVHQVTRKVPVFKRKVAKTCVDFTFSRSATRLPSAKASPLDVIATYQKDHPTVCQKLVSSTKASPPQLRAMYLKNKEKKFSNHTAFRCYHCCGTHGSRVIAETAYLFFFPRGVTKCSRKVNCS